ncbi:MAG: class II fumarate hydratase [Erysipelothrix sp.]
MSTIKDIYGSIEIPEGVYWGANTQRSLLNFPIGVEKMPEDLIDALVILKKAAAEANLKHRKLDESRAHAIMGACDRILTGKYYDQFPLAIWQTGSGTQTNMNANEVIANMANEALGEKLVHPNDHVNCGQSSNDVFPTAMHICTVEILKKRLIPSMNSMDNTFSILGEKYGSVLKTGRTHLQDATPISFGQEISGWQYMYVEGNKQIEDALVYLRNLSIGSTAVGTGLNTYEGFDLEVCNILNKYLDESFKPTPNKFHAMSTKDAFVFNHGALNAIASNSMKMANDIRWLASGPRCGLGEINLPANEAGSSIMPGKVNPTQCEALTMTCVQVMANNQAVVIGSSQGNFELNVYMPLIIYNTWQSVVLLSDALNSFNERCLSGITVNEDKMETNLTTSLMTATFLNQRFGYDETAKIVKEAHQEGLSIKDVVVGHDLMTSEEFDVFFDYQKMIKPE